MRSIRRRTDPPRARRGDRRLLRALVAGAIAAATLGLAGCSEPLPAPLPATHPDDPTPRRGGTLHLASFGSIRGIDPAAIGEGLAPTLLQLLFAGLVDYDDAGNVVPDLAARWETADGGKTYRFFLREGVLFHDGDEVTADDVKRSVERALHPSTPNAYASFYEPIDGFADYAAKKTEHLAGVVVEGKYTIAFHLAQPDATFLPLLALHTLRPVCKSAGTRYSDGWHACGAGPFVLPPGSWDAARGITLVRNEHYFRPGLPYLDAVSFTYLMNVVTQRFKFESGELDVLREFLQPDLVRMQNDARWTPFGEFERERQIAGVSMNTTVPPFDNVEIRRAIAAAIDRDQIRLVKASALRAASQVLPPGVHGYDPAFVGQHFDLAEALEHMRRAGYPYDPATGRGGWPTPISLATYNQGLDSFSAQILQQQLARIGIRIQIKVTSYATFLALTHRRGRTALSPQGWLQDFPDPSDFFEPLFSTRAINDEDSNNTSFYSNPKVDALLDAGRRELDDAKRSRIYGEANRIICDDAPWAFTYTYRWYEARQGYVRGYHAHPVWTESVGRAWIDRGPATSARRTGIVPLDELASLARAATGMAR